MKENRHNHKYNKEKDKQSNAPKDILEELDTSKKEDTDFFFKLGLINSRKRRNTNNRGVGFNLDINNP